MTAAKVIGVCGAGTMGAGIAQLAAQAGARTLVWDPVEGAVERGLAGVRRRLERAADRGRMTVEEAQAAAGRLVAAGDLEELAPCELVIEAAPERLDVKHDLLRRLGDVAPDAVLATNTSSIPVTAVAAGAARPELVVGMHFFNPAPVMQLVEVIAGEQTGERAVELARATGAAMDRRVIDAADGPGFLVNRCNRPFGLEALQCVTEGLATPQEVDRICRLGGGFRMGPFELQDLVGIDTGLEVSKSFMELSFGEPRWRPSPLQARLVAAGRLGRKSGRGWYAYAQDGTYRPEDPPAPEAGGGEGPVEITGSGHVAAWLRELAVQAGWTLLGAGDPAGRQPGLVVECEPAGSSADAAPPTAEGRTDAPTVALCARASCLELGAPTGFFALPGSGLVELTGERDERVDRFFTTLGLHTARVADAPGLVLGRIVCQLVNEACFAVGEGVGSPEDVDDGMVLGLNHPRGPFAWAQRIGWAQVLDVVDGLWAERRQERYRAAPLLRRHASRSARVARS